MSTRELSTFWARRIRWGLKAGQTPAWWPVYIWLSPTRRAFDRSFNRRWPRVRPGVVGQEGESR